MTRVKVKKTVEQEVRYLSAVCGVRYWEDADINGVADDDDNPIMPFANGEEWSITIDLETGAIENWPAGTTADVHYKVCDEGSYTLLDADRKTVVLRDGYVPAMLCPKENGHGDYIIMEIDGTGKIVDWSVDLSYFEGSDE